MIDPAWTRARNGHPTVVLGSVGTPPPDLKLVTGRLDQGESGLVHLARALASSPAPTASELQRPLADRLLFGSAPFDRPAPLFADPHTVACLSGAEGASSDVLDLVYRWLTAERCSLVFVASEPCPLSQRIRKRFGDAAVIEGLPGPTLVARTTEQTLLLLLALQHGGHVTASCWAEAAGTTDLAALAALETLRHTLPMQATSSGYQVDAGWMDQQADTLGPAARAHLPQPVSIGPLTAAEAHALGWFTLAMERAASALERAAIGWSAGTLPPLDSDLPPLARVHLAWEHDDAAAFDTAVTELPEVQQASCRALADARWRHAAPSVDDAASTALLAWFSPSASVDASVRALQDLVAAEHDPARRGRLFAWWGRLCVRRGREDAATDPLGEALPLLHDAHDGVVLADVVEALAQILDADAATSLLGWLEAAVLTNSTHPEGLATCARALQTLEQHADVTDGDPALRRLGLQIDSLQRGTPGMKRV